MSDTSCAAWAHHLCTHSHGDKRWQWSAARQLERLEATERVQAAAGCSSRCVTAVRHGEIRRLEVGGKGYVCIKRKEESVG